jgi:hypothetical protein
MDLRIAAKNKQMVRISVYEDSAPMDIFAYVEANRMHPGYLRAFAASAELAGANIMDWRLSHNPVWWHDWLEVSMFNTKNMTWESN